LRSKSETLTNFGRVSVALGIQYAVRMRYIVIYGLSGSIVLFRIISLTPRFSGGKSYWT